MGVKLQSALGGSVELNAPSTASNFTMTVPAGNGTVATTDQLQNFRNKLINGNMYFAQRGTSQTTAGYGSVDRWFFGINSGTFSATQGSLIDNNVSLTQGVGSYLLVAATSSVGGYLMQIIENVQTLNNQTVTLSYYYNVNSGTDTGGTPYLRQSFGTGGSTVVETTATTDVSVATGVSSFMRRTLTYTLPSTSGKTIGPLNGLAVIIPWAGTFSKSYWGFQLEAGATATTFEQRPLGLEYSLCARYYQKSYALTTKPGTVDAVGVFFISLGYAGASGINYGNSLTLPVKMAYTPTITTYATDTGTAGYARNSTGSNVTTSQAGIGPNGGLIYCNYGSVGAIDLSCHWTASAEL